MKISANCVSPVHIKNTHYVHSSFHPPTISQKGMLIIPPARYRGTMLKKIDRSEKLLDLLGATRTARRTPYRVGRFG